MSLRSIRFDRINQGVGWHGTGPYCRTNRWHKQAAALRVATALHSAVAAPLSLQWSAPLCAAAESAPDDFVKKVVPVIQDRINRRAIRPATCCTVAPPCRLKTGPTRAQYCQQPVATPRRAPGLPAAVLEYSCHSQQTNERYRLVTDSIQPCSAQRGIHNAAGIPCSTG